MSCDYERKRGWKSKPRAIVTGGAGFIGTHLCTKLVNHCQVVCLDVLKPAEDVLWKGIGYNQGHTTKFTHYMENCGWHWPLDVVYHLGECSRVTPSFDNIEEYYRSNMQGTFEVLQYCAKNNVKFVYAGSSASLSEGGMSDSPYSFMKTVNTELVKNYGEWYGLNYAIAYFYNVYGPEASVDGNSSVINQFEQQYTAGQPLTVVKPGTQMRSYTHVDDIVSGLIAIGKKTDNGVYHLGARDQYSLMDIVDMFDCKYNMLPERPGDRATSAIPSSSNITFPCGTEWTPQINLHDYINDIKSK